MEQVRIVLGGEGGQGVQTVAEILADAGYRSGLEALYIPNFGVEQRGGVSLAYVQLGTSPIAAPKFSKAQVAVALSDRAIRRVQDYVDGQTTFIYEASAGDSVPLPTEAARLIGVPGIRLATERLCPRVFNILILGVLLGVLDSVDEEMVKQAMEDRLGYKFVTQPELRKLNYCALEEGRKLVKNGREDNADREKDEELG